MTEREVSAAKEASIVAVSTSEPIVVFDATISSSEAGRRRKISERWQDPIYRTRMSASRRIIWQDPEFRARMHEQRLGRTSPMKGRHHTPEARAKMSRARKGKPRPELQGRKLSEEQKSKLAEASRRWWSDPENRRMMSERRRGRAIPESQKELLSRMFKGRQVSDETRRKISEKRKGKPSPNKGKHLSEEARKKISDANKQAWDRPGYREHMTEVFRQNMTPERVEQMRAINTGRTLTPEHRRKLSEAGKGKKHTAEHIEKTAKKNRGKKRSVETRRKISEARKKNWKDSNYRQKMTESFKRSPKRRRAQMLNIKKALEVWRKTGKLSPQAKEILREKAIKRWREDPGYRRRVSEGISASKADKSIESSLWNLVRRGLMRRIVKEGYLTKAELEELRIFFEVNKGQGRPPETLIEKMSIAVANLVE